MGSPKPVAEPTKINRLCPYPMWLQGFHYRIASGLVEVFSKWFRPSALYPLFYGGKHTDRGYWLLQAGEVKPVHASGLLGLEQLCHNFFNCGEFEVICNHPTEATTVPDIDNVAVLLLTKWGFCCNDYTIAHFASIPKASLPRRVILFNSSSTLAPVTA